MHNNPVCFERDGVLVAAGVLMLVHVLVSAVVFFMKKDRLVFIPNFGNGFNTTWLISLVVCIIVAALIWTRVGNEDWYEKQEKEAAAEIAAGGDATHAAKNLAKAMGMSQGGTVDPFPTLQR